MRSLAGPGLRKSAPARCWRRWSTIIGAAAAGGVLIASCGVDSGETSDAQPAGAVATTPTRAPIPAEEARAGPVLPPDRVPTVDTIAVVYTGAEIPWIETIDTASGHVVARRETAYNPLVSFRRGRGELLLTHQPFEAGSGREHVLDILDLGNGLALKRRISIPGRPNYKIAGGGFSWQAVSNDERYFAVYSYSLRLELAECNARPADGPSCTRSQVRVIDLDSPGPEEWLFELPRHCFGGLVPLGAGAFLATCGDGFYVLERGASEPVGAAPEPRYLTDPVQARNLASGVFWLSPGDGWFGTLMAEGSFVWTKAGLDEITWKAVPTGKQLRWPIFAELGEGRLVAGYVDRYYDQYPHGLAVFDMSTGKLERELSGHNISRSMVAGGPDALFATTRDGRLIRVDVASDTEVTVALLNSDAETVALVR